MVPYDLETIRRNTELDIDLNTNKKNQGLGLVGVNLETFLGIQSTVKVSGKAKLPVQSVIPVE